MKLAPGLAWSGGLWLIILWGSPGCGIVGPAVPPVYDASTDPVGFHRVLEEHLEAGLVNPEQVKEIEQQQRDFERRREDLEKKHPEGVIALAGGQVFAGDSPGEVLRSIDRQQPAAMVYMESNGAWIYGQPFTQDAFENRMKFWGEMGYSLNGTLEELRRQRDSVAKLSSTDGESSPLWRAVVHERSYSADHRMALVNQVKSDSPDALVYCHSARRRQWDVIPAWVGHGDSFQDHRNLTATLVNVGFSKGRERLLKVDAGVATGITLLDWCDVLGLDTGYRGILVSKSFPNTGVEWSVGLVDDLRLRIRVEDGSDEIWQPGLVLISDRSILGQDLMRDLRVFPTPIEPTDRGPQTGFGRFLWRRWPSDEDR